MQQTNTGRAITKHELTHTYYIQGTTGANNIRIQTALQEDFLKAGLRLKLPIVDI